MKRTLAEEELTVDQDVPTPWEPVIPFDGIHTPEIPADFLPGWAGAFVREVSACAQTPESFGVMLGYATLAACLQKRFHVSPFDDSYTEPVGVWCVCVMAPGTRKTFVVESLNEPLVQWEHDQVQQLKSKIDESEVTRNVIAKRIEKLQDQAAKKEDPIERAGLIQEICKLREEMPVQIRAPRLFTNDCTPERFQSLLVENGERMAVLSDEGGIFEVMAGLYSDGKVNLDIFLKSHVGSPVRVDRGSRSAHLNHPFSTFGLAVQPAIIEDLSQGSKRRFRGTGCLARFLFCLPVSNVGTRNMIHRNVISERIKQQYRDGIKSLLNIPAIMVDGVEQPRTLRLDLGARQSFIAYQQALEKRQGETGDLGAIADWSGKLPGEALRLAGNAHVAEFGPDALVMSRATMERALDLADLLIPHALTAFSIMGADPATVDAKYVAKWLLKNSKACVKQNDIYRGCHGRIPRVERLSKALEVLIERHVLSDPIAQPTGGRPSIRYLVNPEFLGASE
jgi:putative DNA primase/helicase